MGTIKIYVHNSVIMGIFAAQSNRKRTSRSNFAVGTDQQQ